MTKKFLVRSPYKTDLPWSEDIDSLVPLLAIMALFLLAFVFAVQVIRTTEVPEVIQTQKQKLPDRLVELVVEKTKRPEPPPVKLPKKKEVVKQEPKPEQPKEVVKKPPEEKPKELVREPRPENPTEQEIDQAREVATQVFQEEVGEAFEEVSEVREEVSAALADLGGLFDGDSVGGSSGSAAGGDDIVSSRAGAGSGGVASIGNGGASSRSVAGAGTGYGRGTGSGNGFGSGGGKVSSSVATASPAARKPSAGGTVASGSGRSNASVRTTMQKYGARFDSIYRRALRQDASLEGNVVLQMTIEPNGTVSSVSVSSSDIDDQTMLSKLKTRIKGINFGPADKVWTGPYTLRFFPQ